MSITSGGGSALLVLLGLTSVASVTILKGVHPVNTVGARVVTVALPAALVTPSKISKAKEEDDTEVVICCT